MVELLVLSVPLVPSQKNKRLTKVLKLELDEETGFFKAHDPIQAPLESTVPGIYLCGGALGPTDIAEAVTQAIAAGMKAISNSNLKQEQDRTETKGVILNGGQ